MSSPVTTPAPSAPPRRAPRSIAGPVVLIILGAIFLLRNFGLVNGAVLMHWFARYWPLLIILWGLIKLLEYYQAQHAGYQPRGIGGGGVVLLIFLIICGLAASEGEKVNWNRLGNEMDIDEDVFTAFGGQTFNYSGDLEQALGGNVSALHVVSDRGDVVVNVWDQPKIKISVNKTVNAAKEADAKQIDEQTKPQINVSGDTITVSANTGGAGDKAVKSNLEIFLPKKLSVDVATKRGDVSIRQRDAQVRAATTRGDVSVDSVAGNVTITVRRGNVVASKIKGDVSVDGRINECTVSEVTGSVLLNGDFFDTTSLSKVGNRVTFKSSRTDLEFTKLQGDMTMQSGDLRANGPVGPLRIVTRAKDIHLEEVSGDVHIENNHGDVEIHSSAPLGNIQVENHGGRVALVVPSKAGFQLDARTVRGDVQSDFDVKIESSGRESHATGMVGGGGPSVRLNTERADIEIRKAG